MQDHSQNIYRIPRVKANLTQERAAELIPISVESIRAYETGQTVPPDDAVYRMVVIYDAPLLAHQHLGNKSDLSRKYLPQIEAKDLPSATIVMMKELADVINGQQELIAIACDGKVTGDEKPKADALIKDIRELKAALTALECALS